MNDPLAELRAICDERGMTRATALAARAQAERDALREEVAQLRHEAVITKQLVQRQRGIIQEAVKKGLGWRAEREALREALREASVALDEAGCQVAASQAHRALQRDES